MGIFDFLVPNAPPEDLQRIQDDLKQRFTYKDYTKKDYIGAKPGVPFTGNCAVYAATARNALALDHTKYGTPQIIPYIMPDGRGHAVTRIGDWVFDNRNRFVVHANQHEATRKK